MKLISNDNLKKKLQALNGLKVKIGIVGKSDSKLLTIAAVNEYGASIKITDKMRKFLPTIGINVRRQTTHIIIPERSYIRSTFDNKKYKKDLEKRTAPIMAKVLLGENEPEDVLEFMGLLYVSFMKNTIRMMREPENHPATIANKGAGKGLLIDEGRLIGAIGYEVTAK